MTWAQEIEVGGSCSHLGKKEELQVLGLVSRTVAFSELRPYDDSAKFLAPCIHVASGKKTGCPRTVSGPTSPILYLVSLKKKIFFF